jgi:sialate O-acetylesterase
MVLRSSDSHGGADGASVWGFGNASSVVTVAIDGNAVGTVAADASGRWEMALKEAASPTPRTITFLAAGGKTATLSNVLFGDVFLCSGQSNMDFCVGGCDTIPGVSPSSCKMGGCFAANETVAAAAAGKWNDIRLMHGPGGNWVNASQDEGLTVSMFSAVCFLTAVQMKRQIPGHTDRPIGLVQSSVGGTVIEMWMSTDALQVCLPPNEAVDGAPCAAGVQQNSILYDSSIAPLAPMRLSGALWYQGESNVQQNSGASWFPKPTPSDPHPPVINDTRFTDYYACLEKAKVTSWRERFQSPDMFYGYVQLAAYGGSDGSSDDRSTDGMVRVFRHDFALEDAFGSHACSFEANMRVTNGIPLGRPPLSPLPS